MYLPTPEGGCRGRWKWSCLGVDIACASVWELGLSVLMIFVGVISVWGIEKMAENEKEEQA